MEPNWEKTPASDATHLCKALLKRDVPQRITLGDALRHDWFKIIGEEPVEFDAERAALLRRRTNLSTLKVALLNMVAQKHQNACLEPFHKVWRQHATDIG